MPTPAAIEWARRRNSVWVPEVAPEEAQINWRILAPEEVSVDVVLDLTVVRALNDVDWWGWDWLVYIPFAIDCDKSLTAWLSPQEERAPYVHDCGYSHGRMWVKIMS